MEQTRPTFEARRNSKGLQVNTRGAQSGKAARRPHAPYPCFAQVLAGADRSRTHIQNDDKRSSEAVVKDENCPPQPDSSALCVKDAKARPQATRRNTSYTISTATPSHECTYELFERAKSAEPYPPGCPTPSILSPELESFPAYHEMGSPTPGTPPDAPYCIPDLYREHLQEQTDDLVTRRTSRPDLKQGREDPAGVGIVGSKKRASSTTSSNRQDGGREKPPSRLFVWFGSLWCM